MLQTEQRAERRHVENVALDRSQQKLNLVERVAHLGTWSWQVQTGRLEWSEEMLRIFGLEHSVFVADLPTDQLAVGREIVFTFYWPQEQRWEGANYSVKVE